LKHSAENSTLTTGNCTHHFCNDTVVSESNYWSKDQRRTIN